MADSMEEIRHKAAGAVFALGHRTADKGRMDAHQSPKAGWIPSPSDPARGYILPRKLREALAYYDITISIADPTDPNRTFAVYTKRLLLEELGDHAEAEAVASRGQAMADSMEEIRRKAAGAVFALGHRSAGKGRMDAHHSPKAGWIPSPNDPALGYILPGKLREALAYYDIAISIADPADPNRAFAVYTKGLLLEELGDHAEAEAAFLSLAGSRYDDAGNKALLRCRQRREGTYSMRAEAQAGFEELAKKMAGKPGVSELLAVMRQAQDTLMAHLDTHRMAAVPAANDGTQHANDDEEAAAAVAQQFVDLLLDQNYVAAKELLHSDLSKMRAKDLERHFEAMFVDEDFPESASVFDSWRNLPNKRADDVATCYVTIESQGAEAVTVTVTREGGALKIREIEWGRP